MLPIQRMDDSRSSDSNLCYISLSIKFNFYKKLFLCLLIQINEKIMNIFVYLNMCYYYSFNNEALSYKPSICSDESAASYKLSLELHTSFLVLKKPSLSLLSNKSRSRKEEKRGSANLPPLVLKARHLVSGSTFCWD